MTEAIGGVGGSACGMEARAGAVTGRGRWQPGVMRFGADAEAICDAVTSAVQQVAWFGLMPKACSSGGKEKLRRTC